MDHRKWSRRNERVRAVPDRERCRHGAVLTQPGLNVLDDAHYGARFPLGLDAHFVPGRVERDRRALEDVRKPTHESWDARGVLDGDANLDHRSLPGWRL